MLGFSRYLTESKGSSTSSQGFVHEIFTNNHANHYIKVLQDALDRGKNEDEAHKEALESLNNINYDHNAYSGEKSSSKYVRTLGPEASKLIHDNSRNTSAAAAEYLKRMYGGRLLKSLWVGASKSGKELQKLTGGKKSNGDLLFQTAHGQDKKITEAHLEHQPFTGFGGSLKYSAEEKDKPTKIYAPGINTYAKHIENHHEQIFGKKSGIQEKLDLAAQQGLENQRRTVSEINSQGRSHHEDISDFMNKLRSDPHKYRPNDVEPEEWEKLIKSARYEPIIDKKTNGVKSANFDENFLSLVRKTVRNKTKGVNHQGLDEFYKELSTRNSDMRNKITDVLHGSISKILDHSSSDPREQERIDGIKRSLHRHLSNIHEPGEDNEYLPTLLMRTGGDGSVKISDSNKAMREHLENPENISKHNRAKGSGTFSVGPGSITPDVRPGTMHNPLSNPINYTIKPSFLSGSSVTYKDGDFDTPIQSSPISKNQKSKRTTAPVVSRPSAPQPKKPVVPTTTATNTGEFGQHRGDGPRLNPDAEHGGRSFYAPHEKTLMKGLV